MRKKKEKGTGEVGIKSFMTAMIVIFIMMVFTYGLTMVVPGGGIPFFQWLFSPILVLFGEDNTSLISIIALLVGLGGIFNCLDKFGVLKFLLDKITGKFSNNKMAFLAVTILFFMLLGSVAGTYEECAALVPVVVAVALRFGWDALTGLGMSILAAGCGFAAGICNPFTIGVAQEIAGLPMFSGMGDRIINFIFIYFLLLIFLVYHIRKIEKTEVGRTAKEDTKEGEEKTFPVSVKNTGFLFWEGVKNILPGILLILMANSIKFTLMEGKVVDIMLESAISMAEGLPGWAVILFIYGLVLVMNFFIPSGSAKAFLLIPLIVPVAQAFGIPAQLCIMAFAFGDGFSNVFYPTNPVLLISLGLAKVSYGEWVKWSIKFQMINILMTSLILLSGL